MHIALYCYCRMGLSGLLLQYFSETDKETECRSGSHCGRVTWLVHDRTETNHHCFWASLWVWIIGYHIMTKIWDKGKSCPSPQYDGGSRFCDIYKQYGYWCETTKCGLTLPCSKDRWLMEKIRKPWFCCLQPLVQTLYFVIPAFYDFIERPQNSSFLSINLEYYQSVHRA